jgi:hypothetical protein
VGIEDTLQAFDRFILIRIGDGSVNTGEFVLGERLTEIRQSRFQLADLLR